MSEADELVTAIRRALMDAADPSRAPLMQAYMKSSMPYRGVAAAPLASICRELCSRHRLPDRASWERAMRSLWDGAEYREERYAALAIAKARAYGAYRDFAALELYRHFIVTGAWWDYVDDVAAHLVGALLDRHPNRMTPVMRRWARNEDMWVRRAAIISQLGRGDRTDAALLAACIESNLAGSRHGSRFFVRKAIGWALRQYARTDPGWVMAFVERHEDALAPLSCREALKHLGQASGSRTSASTATAANSRVR
ncbi:MAG: DNA alkylation repair protein [Candidatus Limnocylindria bacterium]